MTVHVCTTCMCECMHVHECYSEHAASLTSQMLRFEVYHFPVWQGELGCILRVGAQCEGFGCVVIRHTPMLKGLASWEEMVE